MHKQVDDDHDAHGSKGRYAGIIEATDEELKALQLTGYRLLDLRKTTISEFFDNPKKCAESDDEPIPTPSKEPKFRETRVDYWWRKDH